MKNEAFFAKIIEQMENYIKIYNQKMVYPRALMEISPLAKADFRLLEQMTLRNIYMHGLSNMTRLSRLTHLKPSHLTGVISTLIKKGAIKKTQSVDDRRVYYMEFTPWGYEATQTHINNYRQYLSSICLERLTRLELNALKKNLAFSIGALNRFICAYGDYKDDYGCEISGDIEKYDLLELIDKRTKCSNIIISHVDYTPELPFIRENFNHYQFNILVYLFRNGAMSVSSLANESGLKLKYASLLVKGLMERGLVNKSKLKQDMRVSKVVLSSKGEMLAREQFAKEIEFAATRFNALFSESQLDELLVSLSEANLLLKRF